MTVPSLFLHAVNPVIEQELMQMKVLHRFVVTKSNHMEHWINQLETVKSEVAIIEINNLSEKDKDQLLNNGLLADIEFIFIHDGIPNPELDVIMAHGGGFLYRKPLKLEQIEENLEDLFEQLHDNEDENFTEVTCELDQFGLLVGSSKPMRKLYRIIQRVATTQTNVMITGESGSGKELVARTIHLSSNRVDKPFIAINCGAMSPELVESELFGHKKGSFTGADKDHKGVFEQAEGGTLFLDEVTEMLPENQVKLLRVLETGEYRPIGATEIKEVDVRVISATNRDPLQGIETGEFREDLYFRLAHFPLQVPPLRVRAGDIIGLARHFLAYLNVESETNKNLSEEAARIIEQHNWPGNVRELKHVMERAFILAEEVILPEHLNLQALRNGMGQIAIPEGLSLEELEKVAILKALQENEGNKTDTAKILGISVKTLYNKLEKYAKG